MRHQSGKIASGLLLFKLQKQQFNAVVTCVSGLDGDGGLEESNDSEEIHSRLTFLSSVSDFLCLTFISG